MWDQVERFKLVQNGKLGKHFVALNRLLAIRLNKHVSDIKYMCWLRNGPEQEHHTKYIFPDMQFGKMFIIITLLNKCLHRLHTFRGALNRQAPIMKCVSWIDWKFYRNESVIPGVFQ